LVKSYGDEATLRQRIEALKATAPHDIGDLLEITDKYLSGWSPKEFGDDWHRDRVAAKGAARG
jgi:hypothetical protein